MSYCLNHGILL